MNKARLLLSVFLCLTVSSITCLLHANNPSLLPPWYVLHNQLLATLNGDPCVHVSELTGDGLDMEIKVAVCHEEKALALAAFVNRTHTFGDLLAVKVMVYSPNSVPVEANPPSTDREAVALLNRALVGNKYFVKASMGRKLDARAAVAVFQPLVVQYYSDDISDWYLNTNEVAAKVFAEVLHLNSSEEGAVRIDTTTALF